jgi:hypothetical protein
MLSEASYSHLDCVGYRSGIPGPGNSGTTFVELQGGHRACL